jgi:peptide/nickel transport system ATP-binding protein
VALLDVSDLRVSFDTQDGVVHAVRGVSFAVDRGRTLAIVGESGSGKSVATQSILGLTRGARVTGTAVFTGVDLLHSSRATLRRILGAQVGMIFQDPQSSLHPHYRVGWQIAEMIRTHRPDVSRRVARRRAEELLRLVGIPQPEQRVDAYPHQFSGGMRQRAMIAMAMALNPALLIADEPTTALDVTVQAAVLGVIRRLQDEFGTAVILITHDLGIVAEVADAVLVMYAGTGMAAGRRDMFYQPHNPYTEGLLESLPNRDIRPGRDDESHRLTPIRGTPPSMINPPSGCPFHPRCPYVFDRCRVDRPPLRVVFDDPGHTSACWLPTDESGRQRARQARETGVPA